jgi:hypothetical protein
MFFSYLSERKQVVSSDDGETATETNFEFDRTWPETSPGKRGALCATNQCVRPPSRTYASPGLSAAPLSAVLTLLAGDEKTSKKTSCVRNEWPALGTAPPDSVVARREVGQAHSQSQVSRVELAN